MKAFIVYMNLKKAYEFVRDDIPHSWDIKSQIVSRKASEVLINKTGICWTKSCLLATLLRVLNTSKSILEVRTDFEI